MRVWRKFTFDAAHSLPHLPEGHKCRNMHGHTYHVEVQVSGDVDDDGMVTDYENVKRAWLDIKPSVDHRNLNEVLPVSTCEHLAFFLWNAFADRGLVLAKIRIGETADCGVEYEGEQ